MAQLSMSEMVVMFGYVFRELNTCYLAREMGIHAKTVNSFLYKGMAKNGCRVSALSGLLVTYLQAVELYH